MAVYDRWHLRHPPEGARKCGEHRKVPSSAHGIGLQWQVRGVDEDGNPLPKESFKDKQDAVNRDAELKVSVKTGSLVDEKGGKVTFRAYAESWREHRVHDTATAERIGSAFRNHCYEDTGDGAPKDRTPKGGLAIGRHQMRVLARRVSVMQQWIANLPGHANTRLLIITDVSQVFNAAVDDKIIASNPLEKKSIQKPDEVESPAVAWSGEQLDAVAAELPGEMRPMPYLGANCGHRAGELFAAALEDLDFLRKMCHIEWQVKYMDVTNVADVTSPPRAAPLKGRMLVFAPLKNVRAKKSGKPRDVPVADQVILRLSAHLAVRPAVAVTLPRVRADGKIDGDLTRRLVFTRNGQPWYKGTAQRPWNRAVRAAGLPDVPQVNGWHAVRHTAASEWLSKGLGLARAAAYLGDTQEIVLRTYSHFMPDDEDRAREIMNAFFGPAGRSNAPRTTSAAPAGSLCLVNALPLIFLT
jgi:integrase